MKRRIVSFILALTLAVSTLLGTAIFSGAADEEGLRATSLNLTENITVNMAVRVFEPTEGAYAKITLPNGDVDTTQLVENAPMHDGCYVFSAPVAPKDYVKPIAIEICNKDGTTLVAEETTTVADYCENYDNTYNGEGTLSPLIAALKAYAEAADYYFDNTKTNPNAATAPTVEAETFEVSYDFPEGIALYSMSLMLESEAAIRYYYTVESGYYIQNYDFYVDLDNDGTVDPDEKLTPTKKTLTDGSVAYYVEVSGITPNELDNYYTVGVTGRADGKTHTATYGVMNYLANKSGSTNAELVALVAAIANYEAEAAKLTGTVNFDSDGGSEIAPITYERGVNTPIMQVPTKSGATFVGWYDGDKLVTEIPASASGNYALKAKWNYHKVVYDASNKTEGNRFACPNHIDEKGDGKCDTCGAAEGACSTETEHSFADVDGICETCGWCVGNTSCTIDVSQKNVRTACAVCGKTGRAAGGKAVADMSSSGSDKAAGFMRKITLDDGRVVNYWSVDGSAFYHNIIGLGSGTLKYMAETYGIFSISVEVGYPSADHIAQVETAPYYDYATDLKAGFFFRISGGGGSDTILNVEKTTGKFYVAGNSSKYHTLPVGTVEKMTIVYDFTGAVAGDKTQDSYVVMLYNEAAELINKQTVTLNQKVYIDNQTGIETTSNITNNVANESAGYTGDLAWYNSYLFQMRFNSGSGRFLLGDVTVSSGNPFANPITNAEDGTLFGFNSVGEEFMLPTDMEKSGYTFDGWYADAALTQPITTIPANVAGAVTVYPKWNAVIAADSFEFTESKLLAATKEWCEHVDTNEDNICDICTQCVAHVNVTNGVCGQCGYKTARCGNNAIYHYDYKTLDGQGKLAEGTVADSKCDNCGKAEGACIADHTYEATSSSNAACKTCGKAKNFCIKSHEYADVTQPDTYCDLCRRSCKNSIETNPNGGANFTYSPSGEYSIGYSKAVVLEDGTSYWQVARTSGDGPSLEANTAGKPSGMKTISAYLAAASDKIVTYEFELQKNGDDPLQGFAVRNRSSKVSAVEFMRISSNGDVSAMNIDRYTDSNGAEKVSNGVAKVITKITADKVTKIGVVVDFEKQEMRYYVDGLYVASSFNDMSYTELTAEGYGALQMRLSGSGVINVYGLGIYVGDLYK